MAELLWEPSRARIQRTNMYRFMNAVNSRFGLRLEKYDSLYQWSVENIPDFWAAMWDFAQVIASEPYTAVVDDPKKMPGAGWFPGARLNFAENLLRYRDHQIALIFKGEGQEAVRITYAELYDETARVAKALKKAGVQKGDRVVGFMPNRPETIIAMLATTSMGAVWSSCSPDFGIKGVLDRFGQIRPKVLFTADGYFFKGTPIDSLERIATIINDISSVEKVIVVPYVENEPDTGSVPHAILYKDFRSPDSDLNIEFEPLPFDHPLYIMYSSGTTGPPKCMVQSAGGILIHHMKELMLHTD